MEVVQRVRVTCPRCEAPVAGDFKFCPTCAYRLKPGLAEVEAPEAPRPRRVASVALALVAALFVGLFAGIGFWLFRDPARSTPPVADPSTGVDLPVSGLSAATVRKYLIHVPNGTAYLSEPTPELESLPLYVGDLDVLRYEVPVSFYAEFVRDLGERVKRGGSPGPTLERLWNPTTKHDVEHAQRYLSTWIEVYLRHQGLTPVEDTPPPTALLRFVPEDRRREASTKFWALAQAVPFPWPSELGLLLVAPPAWAYVNPWEQMMWTVPPGTESLPVNEVTWTDAVAFGEWLSVVAGPDVTFRLPVAAEWTRIAHGDLPPTEWVYPWGAAELPFACNNLDLYPENTEAILQPVEQRYIANDEGRLRDGRTLEGIFGMAGNVSEWVLTGGERVQRVNDAIRVYYDDEADREVFLAYAYGGSFRKRLIDCTVQSFTWLYKYDRRDDVGFRVVFQPRF